VALVLKRLFWTRLVPALACLKAVAGLAAFFLSFRSAPADPTFLYPLYLFFLVEFGATAALLVLGGREDPRAQSLGFFFLTGLTSWANRPLLLAASTLDAPASHLLLAVQGLQLDALMAYYLWAFVRDFPTPPRSPWVLRRMDAMVTASAAVGIALFVLNLLRPLAAQAGLGKLFALLVPMRGGGIYYGLIISLTAAAFAYLVWKGRSLEDAEYRRLRVFLAGLVCGLGPMLAEILLEFLPFYGDYGESHPRYKLAVIVLFSAITVLVPLGTAYAVLVHRVLDVRLIARRALQYALARYSALALATVPILAFLAYLYVNRDEKLRELFSGIRMLLLLSAAAVGVAALRYRSALLDAVDRQFFREQYDARQILTLLVERIRATGDVASLASLVAREIDLALHLEGISLLVLDARSNMLNDPRRRTSKLEASSPLALLASNASDPLATDLEDPRSPLGHLPEKDRHWLVDSGFKLIVPILARDGSLLGLIGLGQKKSGLPFLKEDKQLLHAIASSSAWVLELAQLHSTGHSTGPRRTPDADLEETAAGLPSPDLAKECASCGTLYPPYTVFCSQCSRRLEVSHVPYVLPGKFRFERRIGSGGMGVVYRGADLVLGRPVAVKTLRRVSPEDAMRLRREARTAAAVTHRHLAPVYGMETWQGTPMLVLELLEGGTLTQRIEKGRMEPLEMVELGIAMADALAQLHASDILHRDIKPSNIGFTRDNVPKLMDFGIARATFDLRRDRMLGTMGTEEDELLPPTAVWNQSPTSITVTKQLVGTLSYLSPEAINNETPSPYFDLWSLAIVLYECLLGRKIFTGGDAKLLMTRIRTGRVPEFSQVLPDADPALEEFFRTALHKTLSRRPATALDMRRRLEAVRSELAALPR
jgi:eukaryotic-like serine/threonine-protein kinase